MSGSCALGGLAGEQTCVLSRWVGREWSLETEYKCRLIVRNKQQTRVNVSFAGDAGKRTTALLRRLSPTTWTT